MSVKTSSSSTASSSGGFNAHVKSCARKACYLANLLYSGLENEEESRPALGEFLERLCLVLYDSLRPLIIHVTHLETLAELTAILRNEVNIIIIHFLMT